MKNAGSMVPVRSLAAAGLLVGLSLAVWATPAGAQRNDDQGMQNAQNACQGDAYKFCNDFIPDRAKVASCLFKNKRQISQACRTVIGGGKASAGKSRKGKRHGKRSRHRR